MKENGFKLAKERSRRYHAQTITDADYADDITLLANTHAQAEILRHSLERAAAGIGLHVNADKTEYMCFNQRGDTSTLKGGPLKLEDKFPYLVSIFSSIKKEINTQVAKAWTAINRLSTIMKTIQVRRTRHARHCRRSGGELISDILLWTPSRGWAKAGRPARTYIQQLCVDTGYSLENLSGAMDDRGGWRERVK